MEPTLLYAAESGSPLALTPFIRNFDINHRIAGDKTALMVAAENGRFGAIRLLIAEGADTTVVSNNGMTAQELAEQSGYESSAGLLQVYQSTNWSDFESTESAVVALTRVSTRSEIGEYESLLESEKFAELRSSRLSCPLQPDEVIWFKATGDWSIGIDNSGFLIWGFKNRRVDDRWRIAG